MTIAKEIKRQEKKEEKTKKIVNKIMIKDLIKTLKNKVKEEKEKYKEFRLFIDKGMDSVSLYNQSNELIDVWTINNLEFLKKRLKSEGIKIAIDNEFEDTEDWFCAI